MKRIPEPLRTRIRELYKMGRQDAESRRQLTEEMRRIDGTPEMNALANIFRDPAYDDDYNALRAEVKAELTRGKK